MKQAQLRVMISEESGHFAAITLPPARGITLASDLTAWSHLSPLTGTASQLYPYDGYVKYLLWVTGHVYTLFFLKYVNMDL